MKAREMQEHFLSVSAGWVNPERTVDGVIVGDPEKDVHTALVTWMSSFDALRAAVERGFDMLITHEPTFFNHTDERDSMTTFEVGKQKKQFVLGNGLVVLRNHDCWDRMPDIGIPSAWGQFLELGDAPAVIADSRFQHRYDIEPMTLDDLARKIATRTAAIGEPSIQVVGDPSRTVSKVGIGTGCACNIDHYKEMGCDVSVIVDDGKLYWRDIQRAKDEEHPVIRVNHGTAEEPGMVTLTQYVNDTFEDVKAEHLPHGCFYRLVTA